jgi:hypothetical protein
MNRPLNKFLLDRIGVEIFREIIDKFPGKLIRPNSVIHQHEIEETNEGVGKGLKIHELSKKGNCCDKTANNRKTKCLRDKIIDKRPCMPCRYQIKIVITFLIIGNFRPFFDFYFSDTCLAL